MVNQQQFGAYSFGFVCDIAVQRDTDGAVMEFMPQSRYAKAAQTPLNRYGSGPFVKFKIPRNLKQSGVYAVTVDGNLKYIGEAVDLSSRYNAGYGNISPKNCYKGGQETNCRLNSLIHTAILSGAQVELWFCEAGHYKAIEGELRRQLTPEWNRV